MMQIPDVRVVVRDIRIGFEIAVDQRFGWVWRPQTISGARGDHAHFPVKSGPKK